MPNSFFITSAKCSPRWIGPAVVMDFLLKWWPVTSISIAPRSVQIKHHVPLKATISLQTWGAKCIIAETSAHPAPNRAQDVISGFSEIRRGLRP